MIRVVDSDAAASRMLPSGAVSPDWSRLYSVEDGQLRVTDPHTGARLGELAIDPALRLPIVAESGLRGGLSPDGGWLALVYHDRDSATKRVTRSHYLVLESSLSKPPVRIDLDGNYQFDALSNGGRYLYLNEYAKPNSGDYLVRAYGVPDRRLLPISLADKRNPAEVMSGSRIASLASRDGAWLYSLYATSGKPFVHALNLTRALAYCVDLDTPAGSDSRFSSLAMSPDGKRLYAAYSGGWVADLTLGDMPQVARSSRFDRTSVPVAGKMEQTAAAAVSPDGRTLYVTGAHGVSVIETSGLTLRDRFAPGKDMRSLAISPDGDWIYSLPARGGGLARIGARTGAFTWLPPQTDTLAIVVRVENSA
jgi:DNA-binding beta-propeller fold protein YncE